MRNCHFGALDQRSYPVTGHTMAFGTLRHVHRPTTPKGTHYTLLLPVGWGAQVPWGGTVGIWRFPVLCGTIVQKKSPHGRWLIPSPPRARSKRLLAATKAMEVDRVPRDECDPPASFGALQGHQWDPVGQAMRKTCAAQCCRGSLYRAFSIGLGAAAVSARRRRRGEFPPSDRPIAHRCSH